MRKILFIMFLFVFSIPIYSSGQGVIKGTVLDADTDEPLIGAAVLIKGTTKGAITNLDGQYAILAVEPGNYELQVSFTGFTSTSQSITVGSGESVQNFSIYESAVSLNEVVVTGTGGPVERKKIGNTIGSIDTKNLADAPITSFSDILAGREPGMVAFQGSGVTGEGSAIRIRGSASLSQLNEPIIIVDGIRVDNGGGFGGGFVGSGGGGSTSRLDEINPESIDRVEILKGASAATLFGTEASNGVIQIFTKQGKVGTPKIDLKFTTGVIEYPKGKIQDNTGFARTAAQAQSLSAFYGESIVPYQLIRKNFTEELFETGTTNQASASVSGGTPKTTYFVSTRFTKTDGPFGAKDNRGYPVGIKTEASDTDQMGQLNLNLKFSPADNFFLRFTSGYTDRNSTTMTNNNNVTGVASLAQFSKPELAREGNATGTIAFATVNETLQISIESDVKHYNGGIGANWDVNDWLKIDASYGIDFSNQRAAELWPFGWNIDGFSGYTPQGYSAFTTRRFLAQTSELKAIMNHQITENLSSDLIVGGQLIRQETEVFGGTGTNFPGPGITVTSGAGILDNYEFFQESVNAGIFAQEQIGIKNMLYITVGGRLDAHSAFGTNFNAQFYPKVSFSYIPSDGGNWNGAGPISSLQLRGSYGWSGLQPGAFDSQETYAPDASGSGPGIVPSNLGNPDLSPEISKEWEAGFTAGLFNNKINLDFTYWDRIVEDAMYARQFSPSGGFRNTQLVNIGEISAHGLEIGIKGAVVKTKDLKIDVFVNGAFIREKVEDLGGAPPLKVGGSYPRYRNFLIEGFAPGANFGAKLVPVTGDQLPIDIANADGQPDTRAELLAFFSGEAGNNLGLPTTPGTGGVLLADDDGDGDLLDHFLGKSTPDWTGAFGFTADYKNFSLQTNFEYKTGNFVVNNLTDAFRQANGAIGRNLPSSAQVERDYLVGGADASGNPLYDPQTRLDALEEWLGETLALSPFSGLNTMENGDFIRMREISLTYRLPSTLLSGIGLKRASVSLAGRNLLLFTNYTGVDPELNFVGRGSGNNNDQNFGQGIAAFGWPIPKQVLLTVRAGF